MGNGVSSSARPQAAFVGSTARTALVPSGAPPEDERDFSPRPTKTASRRGHPEDTRVTTKRRVPSLSESPLHALDASDDSEGSDSVPELAMPRLEVAHARLSQGMLRAISKTTSPPSAAPTSPFLSPHPPEGSRPARASPVRSGTLDPAGVVRGGRRDDGAPAAPQAVDTTANTTIIPSSLSSSASPPGKNTHGLVLALELPNDPWYPPEFGPVVQSPQASADDRTEWFEDQKSMFYQIYLQTHGGSITNTRLKERATAAVLIRERERAPKAGAASRGRGAGPLVESDDPGQSADPVDVAKYVTALYTFSREKTKTTFFIDQDGEMRRLYHTSGWHRLPSLNALARTGSNTSVTSMGSSDAHASHGHNQKNHRSGKSPSSRKKSSGHTRGGGGSRKAREGPSGKESKTRQRSSSIHSFTSTSQWSLGSQSSTDSEFFTSREPPPLPQPILVRNSSFRRISSTSSLKYAVETDKAGELPISDVGPAGGTGELPSASKGRLLRPRVSFTANTSDFRIGRRNQPVSRGQSESHDWEDEDEDAVVASGYVWATGAQGSASGTPQDKLALLKGKMRA